MENGLAFKPSIDRRALQNDYSQKQRVPKNEIALSGEMKWFAFHLGRIPHGANLLLSGDPGVGKSTLALQIAAAATSVGQSVLYIATEQRIDSVLCRFRQICPAPRATRSLTIKDDLYDVSLLPQFLANQLLRPGSDYQGTHLVIIDSLQGGSGVSPHDKRTWSSVMEYFRTASSAGISTLALAHMTKGRTIAGPRTLEHACDATLLLRHGASCRALIVAKNRFGAAQLDPFALTINHESTRLEPSPVGAASTSRVRTIGPGGIVEIEVAITPVRGDRGFVKSPGLTRNEIATVVDLVERIVPEAKALWALGVTVRAPDGVIHRRDQNLAVAVALIAALRRVELPKNRVYIGDLSLQGDVHPPSPSTLSWIEDANAAGAFFDIQQFVLSGKEHAEKLNAMGLNAQITETIDQNLTLMEDRNE